MARVTNSPASRARRKRILKQAKGFRGSRSKLIRYAKDATAKAKYYSYRDRKNRKRTFRALWNIRINAAVRPLGFSYSRFMEALHKANIQIDRKILAELAVNEPKAFEVIVKSVQS